MHHKHMQDMCQRYSSYDCYTLSESNLLNTLCTININSILLGQNFFTPPQPAWTARTPNINPLRRRASDDNPGPLSRRRRTNDSPPTPTSSSSGYSSTSNPSSSNSTPATPTTSTSPARQQRIQDNMSLQGLVNNTSDDESYLDDL